MARDIIPAQVRALNLAEQAASISQYLIHINYTAGDRGVSVYEEALADSIAAARRSLDFIEAIALPKAEAA